MRTETKINWRLSARLWPRTADDLETPLLTGMAFIVELPLPVAARHLNCRFDTGAIARVLRHDQRMPSALFLAVREVLNREDPVGLIELGFPEDEYDVEVEDLVKWQDAMTADRVAAVFLHFFGETSGQMPADKAARIADAINLARAEYLSD